MTSLVIIIAQIILKDYTEIRWGMILCSLLFLCLFVCFIVSVCLLDWNTAIPLLLIFLLSLPLENQFLPILWKTKKLKRDH